MKMDEYVPTTTPIIMVSEKSESALPPKMKSTSTAVKVVTDVRIVLESVALIAAFITSLTSPR